MNTATPLFTDKQKEVLEQLALGLFPLQEWINSKSYKPEENPSWIETSLELKTLKSKSIPWRDKDLQPRDIGIIEAIEGLIRDTSSDVNIIERWKHLESNPLLFHPNKNVDEWRKNRGLSSPEFIGTKTENITSISGEPLVRKELYDYYLPIIENVWIQAKAQTIDDIKKLAKELFMGSYKLWPSYVKTSSIFVKQYARDVLFAMVGMKNFSPYAEFPEYKYALLIELGEHRRVGNQFDREQVAFAVDLVKKTFLSNT